MTLQEAYQNITTYPFTQQEISHKNINVNVQINENSTINTTSQAQFMSITDCYINITINSSINNVIVNVFTNQIPLYIQNSKIIITAQNNAQSMTLRLTDAKGVYVNTQLNLTTTGYIYSQMIFGKDILTTNLLYLSNATLSSQYQNKYYTSCSRDALGSSICYNETNLFSCNFQSYQKDSIQDTQIKIGYCEKPGQCVCDQNQQFVSGNDAHCDCNANFYIAQGMCRQLNQNERGYYFEINNSEYYWNEQENQSCKENYTYNKDLRQCYKNCDQSCIYKTNNTADCVCQCNDKIIIQEGACIQQCEQGYNYVEEQCYTITQNKNGQGYIKDNTFIYTSCNSYYEFQNNDCIYIGFGEKQIQNILIGVIVGIFVLSVILLIISAILNRKTKMYNQKLMN